jgi:hypothetical protein
VDFSAVANCDGLIVKLCGRSVFRAHAFSGML